MFVVGFERGLRAFRPLLRGPGLVVESEATWLRPLEEVPRDVIEFWAEGYPPMTDIEGNLALARQAGFTPLDHFTLPEEGWAAYVDPLERRMNEVLAQHPGDLEAEEAARYERREFAMFRNHLRPRQQEELPRPPRVLEGLQAPPRCLRYRKAPERDRDLCLCT